MFKSLLNTLAQKQQRLQQNQTKSSGIQATIQGFLTQCFGDEIQKDCQIQYSSKDDQVVIITHSRVVATDLQLRQQELLRFLKENNAICKKITIR